MIALTAFVKHQEMAGLFTSTTPTLLGGTSVTEAHISTICDSIILLRYVEIFGEMRRGLTVLKMRGSPHDKEIREFTIDGSGMHIGKAFRNVSGIISGAPVQLTVAARGDRAPSGNVPGLAWPEPAQTAAARRSTPAWERSRSTRSRRSRLPASQTRGAGKVLSSVGVTTIRSCSAW